MAAHPRYNNEFGAAERFLLEKIHQKMSGHSPIARVFCFFDRRKNGLVSYEDFRQVLLELGLNWGEQQTLEVFDCYDTNSKGYLHYDDFRRILMRDSKGLGVSSFDKRDSEKAPIAASLSHVRKGVNMSSILKSKIYQRDHGRFSMLKAFRCQKRGDKLLMKFDDFRQGCTRYGLCVTAEDLQRLYDGFEKHEDGTISYQDFVDQIMAEEWSPENGLVPKLSSCDATPSHVPASTVPGSSPAVLETNVKQYLQTNNDNLDNLVNYFARQDRTGRGLITFPQFRRAFQTSSFENALNADGLRVVFERHRQGQNEAIRYREFIKQMVPDYVERHQRHYQEHLRHSIHSKDFSKIAQRITTRPQSSRLP